MPASIDAAVNFDDLRKLAKRRLPKIAYDFIEGGLEDEGGIARNYDAFRRVPAGAALLRRREHARPEHDPVRQDLLEPGRHRAHRPHRAVPARRRHDAGRGRQGRQRALHHVRHRHRPDRGPGPLAPDHGWYQLYVARDRGISEDMVRRARDAGLSTLAITLDVPINSKRERNIRNGFVRPLEAHAQDQDGGLPASGVDGRLPAPRHADVRQLAALCARRGDAGADRRVRRHARRPRPVLWKDVETFRRLWPGKLVLKGVMHPDDAIRAAAMGVDGVMVSNHGGAPARPRALADRGAAGHQCRRRRQDDGDVRQRHPPRLRHHRGAVPGREVRVRRPAHALRRGGGRRPRRQRGRSASSRTRSIARWRRWARPT